MTCIDALPPLGDVIRTHGLRARKSLGQNFLLDLNLTRRIARAAGALENAAVIEIGPGPGGLSRALLACGVAALTLVERDRRCVPALAQIARASRVPVQILEEDALAIDYDALAAGLRARIGAQVKIVLVANLPYNIATALLTTWLETPRWPPWYDRMTLMFQREVAQRLVAAPGSRSYGRLSVLTQWRTTPERLFDISPRAFTPAPKVTSSLVRFTPIDAPLACDMHLFSRVSAAAFGQRRKMLRSSLKTLGMAPSVLLAACNIDGRRRAETLTVAEFVALTNAYGRAAGEKSC